MDVAGSHSRIRCSFPNAYNIFGYLCIYLLRVFRFLLVLRHLLCICSLWASGLSASFGLRSYFFLLRLRLLVCAVIVVVVGIEKLLHGLVWPTAILANEIIIYGYGNT